MIRRLLRLRDARRIWSPLERHGATVRVTALVTCVLALALSSSASGQPPAKLEDLPRLRQLPIFQPGEPSLLYDDEGVPFSAVVPEYRVFVPLSNIPMTMRQAIIAAEDARFYRHGAVDLRGIARATIKNLMAAQIKEGGSTITQQLAKTLFLSHARTIERKMRELELAWEIEQRYTKDQILEMYLNSIYFGHGAYGVEAAARTYFGKGVAELSLPEAALLAGLPRAPGRYSPLIDARRAKSRRQYVLDRMVATGVLKKRQAQRAARSPITVHPFFSSRGSAPWFVDYVRQQLDSRLGAVLVRQGGLRIYTTLNLRMQRAAVSAMRRGIAAVAGRNVQQADGREAAVEGALIALDAETGEIKAMVGGADYGRSQYNRAVQARRQPGSAFKPFVYAAAFERGLTPATVIDDAPIEFRIERNGRVETWSPENVDRQYRGPVTLRTALEQSINVPTIRLIQQVGVDPVIDLARRLGMTSELRREYALALGVSEVSLLELASAYQPFANRGVLSLPTAVRKVVGPGDVVLEEHLPAQQQVLSEGVAFLVTSMMEGVVERGTGKAAGRVGRPAAAKTGTSQAAEDLWFIGYTPSLLAAVWLGYDQRRSLGSHETAGKLAAPVWVEFMKQSLHERPVEAFLPPEGVTQASVNRRTGVPAAPADPEAVQEYFIAPHEGSPGEVRDFTSPMLSLPASETDGGPARSGANGP
jgi:penicillin-binding protein 1A